MLNYEGGGMHSINAYVFLVENCYPCIRRLTISELGRTTMLEHPRSSYILQRLIQSLGNDPAGRSIVD